MPAEEQATRRPVAPQSGGNQLGIWRLCQFVCLFWGKELGAGALAATFPLCKKTGTGCFLAQRTRRARKLRDKAACPCFFAQRIAQRIGALGGGNRCRMNRLLLLGLLMLPTMALANAHHHSSGGSSSGSDGDLEGEGACLTWAAADAGVDAGVAEAAEAADAGHPGEVCTEHAAKGIGCSVLGFGLPTGALALLWLRPRARGNRRGLRTKRDDSSREV